MIDTSLFSYCFTLFLPRHLFSSYVDYAMITFAGVDADVDAFFIRVITPAAGAMLLLDADYEYAIIFYYDAFTSLMPRHFR